MANTEIRGEQIKDVDITVADIADGAVTLAKMANISQYYIIGRKSASAGPPEAVSAVDVASMMGIQNPALHNLTIPASGTVALATGYAAGQTIYGGTAASDPLALYSTSNATKGLITVGGVLYVNEASLRTGIGIAAPQSLVHIWSGNAGADPAWTSGVDTIIFENSGNLNIQYFTPDTSTAYIGFSSPTGRNRGLIAYNQSTQTMALYVNETVAKLNINPDGVAVGKTAAAQKNTIADVEIQGYNLGAILSLTRNDTGILADDLIGEIQFYSNDTQLTSKNVVASIATYSSVIIATDAPRGYMVFGVSGGGVGAAPIEHMRFSPTTVAKIGFFGVTPVVRPTATSAAAAAAPAGGTGTAAGGWSTAANRNIAIDAINNSQTRIQEIIDRLVALGLFT